MSISAAMRKKVAERAQFQCEYCRIQQDQSFFPFQIDHIISEKHNGPSSLNNLALSCFPCNNNKGSDITTILYPEANIVRLFHPRTDVWDEHFLQDDGEIIPLTDIGRATIKLLKMNDIDRILERRIMAQQ